MKKLLFGILTFLGIGLSFCNADGVYHNPDLGLISIVGGGNTLYTLQDKNLGAVSYYSGQTLDSSVCGNFFQWGNNTPYSFNGTYTKVYCSRSSSYGPGNYFYSDSPCRADTVYPNNWGAITNTVESMQGPCSSGYHLIYTWSSFVDSLTPYFNFDQFFFKNYLLFPWCGYRAAGNNDSNVYQFGNYSYYLQAYFGNSSSVYGDFFAWLGDSYFNFSVNLSNAFGASVRCLKNDVVDPDYTRITLTGDVIQAPADPKFIVNYGNTSYEYTLEDNLEIRLNSPVLKDGDNYSYAGSTGINLFYNGGSQFYNKSELYLFTPSWYSANIFNPICL